MFTFKLAALEVKKGGQNSSSPPSGRFVGSSVDVGMLALQANAHMIAVFHVRVVSLVTGKSWCAASVA